MPSEVTLSVPRVGQVLETFYGEEVRKKFTSLMDSKNLSGDVTVYQDTPGDGEVTIRYGYVRGGHPISRLLSFNQSGVVSRDGDFFSETEVQGEEWRVINTVLISLAFGTGELNDAVPVVQSQNLASAMELYRGGVSPSRQKEAANNRADHYVSSIARFFDITERQLDRFFSPYDADDIKEVMERHLPTLQSLKGGTAEGSRRRSELAWAYLKDVLATNEGAKACEMAKQCAEEYTSYPDCSGGDIPVRGATLFFEGLKVRSSEACCREKPEREPKEHFSGKY